MKRRKTQPVLLADVLDDTSMLAVVIAAKRLTPHERRCLASEIIATESELCRVRVNNDPDPVTLPGMRQLIDAAADWPEAFRHTLAQRLRHQRPKYRTVDLPDLPSGVVGRIGPGGSFPAA